jgi:hypothetical protein
MLPHTKMGRKLIKKLPRIGARRGGRGCLDRNDAACIGGKGDWFFGLEDLAVEDGTDPLGHA